MNTTYNVTPERPLIPSRNYRLGSHLRKLTYAAVTGRLTLHMQGMLMFHSQFRHVSRCHHNS